MTPQRALDGNANRARKMRLEISLSAARSHDLTTEK
jgi:hypothetical protein